MIISTLDFLIKFKRIESETGGPMAIPLDVASTFAPRSVKYRTQGWHSIATGQRGHELNQQPEVAHLAKIIFETFHSKLTLPGKPPSPLHPALEAALTRDATILARYLVRRETSEYRRLLDLASIVDLVAGSVGKLPRSPAYEDMLVGKGCDPVVARALAHLAIRIGKRVNELAGRRSDIVKAIRYFSKPMRPGKTAFKKAAYLLEASQQFSALEAIFPDIDLENEFIELLYGMVEGDHVDFNRLREIAVASAPNQVIRRGRKPSAASVAHEFLLHHIQHGYTWRIDNEDFSDAVTVATRTEFDDPDFSPRAARRRVRAMQKAPERF